MFTALAALVACDAGLLALDQPAGPPGSTLRHLLAHASGLAPSERRALAKPGRRRIYSNSGYEVAAEKVARATGIPFADYLHQAIIEPLGLDLRLEGSPAFALSGTIDDIAGFACELLQPKLVSAATMREATSVQFPGLSGVVPGYGRKKRNDWGLGFAIRGSEPPHWTGERNSPRTFGHIGGGGGILWVDPEAELALTSLSGREFGAWAKEAWPRLSDAVLVDYAAMR